MPQNHPKSQSARLRRLHRRPPAMKSLDLIPPENSFTHSLQAPISIRTLSGLAKDTGLSKAAVNSLLSRVIQRGFVVQGQNRAGQPRWFLSTLGRSLAAALSPKAG